MAERVCCLYRASAASQTDHDQQEPSDISIQRKACREFAREMGWTIVKEQEAGTSSTCSSFNEPDGLQLIKKEVEQGAFDILLVFMFDRLGRKPEETPFVVEWFTNKGIRVWSVSEGEQHLAPHAERLLHYIRFWQEDNTEQNTSPLFAQSKAQTQSSRSAPA